MSLDFSALYMLFDNNSPNLNDLNSLCVKDQAFSVDNTHYLISISVIEDKYMWLYAKYGSSYPYSSTVYNTENNVEEDNPRTTGQVETGKQLFAIYSLEDKTLYLSNTRKKSLVENYLKSRLDKDVNIKNFYKNVDEFIDKIETVEKIRFIAKSNLFSAGGAIMKIFPNPRDVYGLGMPDDFCLEANYSKTKKTEEFIKFLKQLVNWKNSCEAEQLICIGRDDDNFETIFNAESFVQKISISVVKDKLGIFDEEQVKETLLRKLGDV